MDPLSCGFIPLRMALLISAPIPLGCVLSPHGLGLWPLLHHPALTVIQATLERP